MAAYGPATVHERYTPTQLANAIRATSPAGGGFSIGDGTARVLAAIAMAESGGRSDATNHNLDGSDDLGPWQINTVNWMSFNKTAYADGTWSQLDVNALMAAKVWKAQGLDAWVAYKNGKYKDQLGGVNFDEVTPAGGKSQTVYANSLANLLAHLVSGEFWKRVLMVAAGVALVAVGFKTFGS